MAHMNRLFLSKVISEIYSLSLSLSAQQVEQILVMNEGNDDDEDKDEFFSC